MDMSSLKDSLRRTKEKMLRPSGRSVQAPVTPPPEYDQTEQLDSEPTDPPITLAVIGAGQRGKRYSRYALANPKLCKVVAVAEPREKTREIFATNHAIPETGIFTSYQDLLAASQKLREETGKRIADAVVIAVQDKLHAEVVLKCVAQGFDILCEKPMATTPEDCIAMADAVAGANVIFGMGHVLRYSPYNHRLVETIRSGELGQLINVVQIEPVGHQHFAHSYVRGNWAKEADSSFSLMTKSCHDMDIVCHYLYPATPLRVSSFGSLTHFKKSAKPQEAGEATRCLECPMERECPYSAKRIYLDPVSNGCLGWPASVLTDGPPDIESITHALKTGPYGQCVYESENDVADHQVVNLEFSTGATVSLTMVAFSTLICDRQTRLHFTHGEIVGDMYTLVVTNFKYPSGHPSRTTRLTPKIEDGGHGGGDLGLIRAFVKAVRERDQSVLGTDVMEVLRSHLIVFAAEKGRREGKVVTVDEFEAEVRKGIQEKIEKVAVSSEGYPAAPAHE
ncbi:hypothetical protein FRC04_008225 [Tulasnella sp. 424]|nr:hypothetical protein FRC04_008225 [Tulasnella sp. 424]KAG8974501.1 hypothetical protein FRC05_007300 [Tulasnella sp. 425]